MKKLLLAFQFLTIIPLKVRGGISNVQMSRSAVFFPVVGAFQGILAAGAAYLSAKYFGMEMAPAAALLILAASNGGFHFDGLADTFDAMAVKSSGDNASDIRKRLSVMKDASTGPIGVISIVFAVLLKFLLLKGLFHGLSDRNFYAFLFLMPVYSKWSMVPPMYHGISARKDGLGNAFIGHIGIAEVVICTGLAIIISFLAHRTFLGSYTNIYDMSLFLILLMGLYLFGFASARYCSKKFGGLTGDIFGAIGEISEILFLLGVSAWSLHSI